MANKYDIQKGQVPVETTFDSTPLGTAVNTVFGLPKALGSVAKTIGRGISRNIASAGVTFSRPLGGVDELKPEGRVFKTLFGDEPIKSLEDRVAGAELYLKDSPTAQKYKLDKIALPLAFGAIIGESALDLTPLVGTKTAVKALVKETNVKNVVKLLMKSGVPEDVAKAYAPKLARTTTKREVIDTVKLLQGSVGSKLTKEATKETDDAVSKLIRAVKEAEQPREALEEAFTAERARRAGTVKGVFETGDGQKGYYQALSKLKGQLAEEKKFELVKLAEKDVDELFNIAQQHPHLDVFDKITTQNSLDKLLNGKLPTKSELILLEDVYGRELVSEILKKRSLGSKLGDAVTEAMNIPRTIITSFDMSAPLRQGILFITKPKAFAGGVKEMFRQVFSPKNFKAWLDDLPNHPNYNQMKASKLYIADPDSLARGLSGKEEAYMSNLAEKIPVIGQIVKASERAFVSFLNKLRVDVFSQLANKFGAEKKLTVDELKSIANFVNVGTGRGGLGSFERSAQALNTAFFSPRLISARFSLFNPVWYANQTPQVRREAIKTFAKFIATGTTIISLINTAGGKDVTVESDPRSSDFGKIKAGNTRWDIWGGFQQWVRVFSQISTGKKKTLRGDIVDLSPDEFPFDTRLDVATRFGRGKLAPIPGLALEIVDGQKLFGGDIEVKGEIAEKIIPLYLQDLKEAIDEEGAEALFNVGIPAFFGVGVQTYKPKKSNKYNK